MLNIDVHFYKKCETSPNIEGESSSGALAERRSELCEEIIPTLKSRKRKLKDFGETIRTLLDEARTLTFSLGNENMESIHADLIALVDKMKNNQN